MVLIRQLLLIFLILISATPVLAINATPVVPVEKEVSTPSIPSLSDLGPRQLQLVDFIENSTRQLSQMTEFKIVQDKHQKLVGQLKELQQQVATLGDPTGWYVDRLSQVNIQFRQMRKGFEDLQKDLTARQQGLEGIQNRLQEEDTFWQNWAKSLKKKGVTVPDKTVRQIKKDLSRLQATLKKAATSILGLQEKIGSDQQVIVGEIERFESALIQIRKETFRKNSFSFFTSEFYAQLTLQLWQQAQAGLIATLTIDLNYLKNFDWLLSVMVLTLFLCAAVILHYRGHFQTNEDWQFVLAHPWATACFAVVVGFTPLFAAPPELFRFSLMTCGVIAVTILAVSLMENRRQARILMLAALLLLTTTAFRLIALPQPYYRLYIALLALSMIPVLIWQGNVSLQTRGIKAGRFYRLVLRIATIVLLVSLVGQISGYMNFSFWLLQSTFETGMVMLFAHMAMRLGNGGIIFFLSNEKWAQKNFFKKFANEFSLRLEKILRVIVVVYSLFYLLPVWRIFATMGDAWNFFEKFAVQLGAQSITLRMVLLALISFYLAMQISWLLQAMSETQVFYRKSVDRGVRDAIKKLIHYAMVLIGFLFVLSSLGMSLQNFVVVLGALGVGIGFGLQDIVNNFLSGLILLFERPVKIGDAILIDGEYGTVVKIGLRSTVVETLDQAELIVPNAQIISQKVTNWTLSNRRVRLVVPVGVAYGSDIEKVMSILAEAGETPPDVLDEPPPSPIFIAFGDSSLDFELRIWIPNVDARPRVKSELLRGIDQQFRKAEVEIPFPQHDLHLRSVDGKVMKQVLKDNPAEAD